MNHTTGAQRYNKRTDAIFDFAKRQEQTRANLNQFFSEMGNVGLSEQVRNSVYNALISELPKHCSIADEREIISGNLMKLKKAIQSTFINS
mgnify:CR=1 FL=1